MSPAAKPKAANGRKGTPPAEALQSSVPAVATAPTMAATRHGARSTHSGPSSVLKR